MNDKLSVLQLLCIALASIRDEHTRVGLYVLSSSVSLYMSDTMILSVSGFTFTTIPGTCNKIYRYAHEDGGGIIFVSVYISDVKILSVSGFTFTTAKLLGFQETDSICLY